MKSQKGVTLIALTVYVIVMALVVGILATITNFFYKNINDTSVEIDPITEYTTFNSFISDEVNRQNIKVIKCGVNTVEEGNLQDYILFSNGVQYTYIPKNKGIYRNKVKICRNVDSCSFTEEIDYNGRTIITVNFRSGNTTKEIKYTIAN